MNKNEIRILILIAVQQNSTVPTSLDALFRECSKTKKKKKKHKIPQKNNLKQTKKNIYNHPRENTKHKR